MALTKTQVSELYVAIFNRASEGEGNTFWQGQADAASAATAMLATADAQSYFGASVDTDQAFIEHIYLNTFNKTNVEDAAGITYWVTALATESRGSVVAGILAAATDPVNAGAAQDQFNNRVAVSNYAADNTDLAPSNYAFSLAFDGGLFVTENLATVAGAQSNIDNIDPSETGFLSIVDANANGEVMRVTGDQSIRVDLTDVNNQITGVDLNNNGVIANDGIENNQVGRAAGFMVVDAYARNPLNTADAENNFLGDIDYDGTGYQGDGVSTNGNIFLGGLGHDDVFAGIGNDFLTGGQNGGDILRGGRNADVFYVESSALSDVSGDGLRIDGGNTFDNDASQDSDWLIADFSDDDEPVTITLNDSSFGFGSEVLSRSGTRISADEIEHFSGSGNLFDFLNGYDVQLGGGTSGVDANGNAQTATALGSTAQLIVNGSSSDNIVIGGYDNDDINGNNGNDILFGGDMQFLTANQHNPNITQIVNDGRDELSGGAGADEIVFEMDGGIIDGGFSGEDEEGDTLWLTDFTGGTQDSAAALTTDETIRIDLAAGITGSAGYGGADVVGTQDQTNYANESNRVTVTNMENVNATGLGAIDFDVDGGNTSEVSFMNQANYFGVNGDDLDLRGNSANNNLYANTGDDVLEGRSGNDNLMGGDGNDDFIFDAGQSDGLDVIHRLVDADGNNIWDTAEDTDPNSATFGEQVGLFGQDFGLNSSTLVGASDLTVDFQATDLSLAQVAVTQFVVSIGGVSFNGGDVATLSAANNTDQLAAILNTAFSTQDANVTVSAVGNTVVVLDAQGRTIDAALPNTVIAGTATNGTLQTVLTFDPAASVVSQDRLIFTNYEDRADAELIDDDATVGSDVTLGSESYAQDKVVSFSDDGTRIAESQQYNINLLNLAVEDVVTITVNGVDFTRQVGVDSDGTLIAGESTGEFAERMSIFINDFLDDDTAAGDLDSGFVDSGNSGLVTISEASYHGEETVFLNTPVVTIDSNESNGEPASATVINVTDHEVHLLDFDGRNANLNEQNVIFRGDTGVNRAVLATAADTGGILNGSDVIVVNASQDKDINSSAAEGLDGAEINFNVTPNIATDTQTNYVVHGDDLLIGGNGADVINGGTGDDRVHGSLGTDTLDGGKNVYLQDGELRVYNEFEALQADANPLVIDLERLDQDADSDSGIFDDTLIYQQSDFGDVGAAGSAFEITLNLDTDQVWGGAGKFVVDNNAANTALFTNFENIRTVSGDGTLAGQGQDTLDLSVSVNPITGAEAGNNADMFYFLTRDGNAGKVQIDATADAIVNPVDLIVVDGVEHVLTGGGDDTLTIDETEAGKDNTFNAGLGDDTINYSFNLNGNDDFNPTMTLTVNGGGADVDYMDMTGGSVGLDAPRDTLTSVETINLDDAPVNPAANDVLDVTNVFDSVVDFVNGEVRDGNGNVQVNINLMSEFEIVNADFNDTVIVSDAMANSNASSNNVDITFDSFLNYDNIDPVTFARESLAVMRANNETNNSIPRVENLGLFTFNMGPDSDTVDYSNETGLVAAVANFEDATNITVNNVLVSNDGDTSFTDNSNRVDALTGTENLVASAGESIIDLTGATTGLKVRFNADDGAFSSDAALDRDVFRVQLTELNSATPVAGMNFLSYEDAGNIALVNQVAAEWNTVEGSDNDVMVELTDHETAQDHTFNLRGGNNEANYNELTRSIEASIDIVGDEIQVTNTFTDGNGLTIGGTDLITSHTAQNTTSAGTLRIEASQDAEDSVTFAVGLDKVFLLGEVVNGSDQITVTLGDALNANSMILTGFEVLKDATSDDVYTMDDLDRVLNNITLQDDNYPGALAADRDTIKVFNDAVAFDGGPTEHETPLNSISLEVMNDTFVFDFDLLDITDVTTGGLTLLGDDDDQDDDGFTNPNFGGVANYVGDADTNSNGYANANRDTNDTVILGDLSLVDDVQLFDVLAVTDASGTSFDFDATAGELQTTGGATLFTFDADADTLDGTRLTADATMTVTGAGNIAVLGGSGDDTITGGTGNNTITGGAGADTLNGGVTPAVGATYTVAISGVTATSGADGDTMIIGGLTITTATVPALVTDIAVAADADQIGAVFAAQTLASWSVALDADGLTPAEANALTSVTYDATTNELSFVFNDTATSLTGGGNLIALTTAPAVTGAAVLGATETETDFAPQVDTADTFVYNADSESTEAAMDSILNFTVGATDDVIDFSALDHTHSGVDNAGSVFTDFGAVKAAAIISFDADNSSVYVGSDGTDTWVFHDADTHIHDNAFDSVIVLVGIDATGIDANNFAF